MLTINDFSISDRVAHITMGVGVVAAKWHDRLHVLYDWKIDRGPNAGKPTEGIYDAKWFELCHGYLVKGESHPRSMPIYAAVADQEKRALPSRHYVGKFDLR